MPEAQAERTLKKEEIIAVENLTVGYGEHIVLKNVSFSVGEGEILTVLGPSGCGKSTLLKAMVGLLPPRQGKIRIAGVEIASIKDDEALSRVRQHIGVLFQSGALIDFLTVAENVALPLHEFSQLPDELIDSMVQLKLDLVKLGRQGHLKPSELSGGMTKRAGLARAMALDPQILFFDEPASGLDPATAVEIDDLLLELNKYFGVTLVVITHELATIENISDRCLMLDGETKGIIAEGPPGQLKNESDERVRSFFQRGIREHREKA
ncbi:MAG: ATP-binding cassette domain-containing protein [Desulfuromonadales bacterium]